MTVAVAFAATTAAPPPGRSRVAVTAIANGTRANSRTTEGAARLTAVVAQADQLTVSLASSLTLESLRPP